jgi:hypothetical protein
VSTSSEDAPNSAEQLVPLSAIKASAILRMISDMGTRFNTPPSSINYLFLAGGTWSVFSTAHHGYYAGLDGSGLAPIP